MFVSFLDVWSVQRDEVCEEAEDLTTLTDEEDGKGDKEEEDMRHHIESVQEAAVI